MYRADVVWTWWGGGAAGGAVEGEGEVKISLFCVCLTPGAMMHACVRETRYGNRKSSNSTATAQSTSLQQ